MAVVKGTAFCAKNHKAWWSRKYPNLTNDQIFKIDPAYMLWAKENLKHLRFNTGMQDRIKKYKRSLTSNPTDNGK